MFDVLSSQNAHSEHYAVFLRDDIDLSALRHNNTHKQTPMLPQVNQSLSLVFYLVFSDFIPQVGFIYHRSAWGCGFSSEALTVYFEMIWKRPRFEVVEVDCDSESHASANVLRKCGFDLLEALTGKCEIPWKKPSSRDFLRFRLRRL
ncbi:hypothetical protein N7451_004692 [Penicillium sp. IBT 35674x]|nr:hypothetical protein N7451_004692 [Penicillium sp. IBT 35674x]